MIKEGLIKAKHALQSTAVGDTNQTAIQALANTERELQKAQATIQKVEKKYTRLFEFSPTGLLLLSDTGVILSINQSGLKILQQSPATSLNKLFYKFISEESKQKFDNFIRKIFGQQANARCKVTLNDTCKVPREIQLTGSFADNKGEYLIAISEIPAINKNTIPLLKDVFEKDTRFNKGPLGRAYIQLAYDKLGRSVDFIILKANRQFQEIHEFDPEEKKLTVLFPEIKKSLQDWAITFNPDDFTEESLRIEIFHEQNKSWFDCLIYHLQADIFLISLLEITKRKNTEYILHETNVYPENLINYSNVPIIVWDTEFRITKFNHAFETLTGRVEADVIGHHLEFLFPASLVEKSMNLIHKTISGELWEPVEIEILHLNQSIKTVLWNSSTIFAKDLCTPIATIAQGQEITERKKAELSLKVSEEKYRTMLNASPDGIFLLDLKGTIIDVSEIGSGLFGFERKEELVGKYFLDFIPKEEKENILEAVKKTISEGILQNIEIKIQRENQTQFLCDASATLIQNVDGTSLSYMVILRDISQRKLIEAKQIHADRMANLGEMATGIAHEINQPLNIISMVVDKIIFESSKTNSIDMDFFEIKSNKIFENILRIQNIIDHIKAFSRSKGDSISSSFDINTSINNAKSLVSEQFKHLGIDILLHLDPQISTLFGNTYKLEQVIINLLINAKDAILEKKSLRDDYSNMIVGIKTYQEDQTLIIEVTDNGIGIDADNLNHILLPFFTTKAEGKGTGLGLSICYQILKDMGGTIDINSAKNEGTLIKLIFNLEKKSN